jgi:putative transposase
LELMQRIDELYTAYPFYGSRKMTAVLPREGHAVNRKRVRRLMRLMGLQSLAPRPHTRCAHPAPPVYPYLLAETAVERPNQVWATSGGSLSLDKIFGSISDELPGHPVIHGRSAVTDAWRG